MGLVRLLTSLVEPEQMPAGACAVTVTTSLLWRRPACVSRPRRWPGTAPVPSWLVGEDGDDTLGPLVWQAPHEEVYADASMAVADELAEGPAFPPPAWWRDQASCLGPPPADRWRGRAGSWAMRVQCGMAWCALGWAMGVFAETPSKLARKSCARVRLRQQ
jgi:hypothetical protein